jgi:hypothetical protein
VSGFRRTAVRNALFHTCRFHINFPNVTPYLIINTIPLAGYGVESKFSTPFLLYKIYYHDYRKLIIKRDKNTTRTRTHGAIRGPREIDYLEQILNLACYQIMTNLVFRYR